MCTFQLLHCSPSSFYQTKTSRLVSLNQLDDHFSICFRGEDNPFVRKLISQFLEVFHNSVVNNHHISSHSDVRVGIAGAWLTVSRPTRMSNPCMTRYGNL